MNPERTPSQTLYEGVCVAGHLLLRGTQLAFYGIGGAYMLYGGMSLAADVPDMLGAPVDGIEQEQEAAGQVARAGWLILAAGFMGGIAYVGYPMAMYGWERLNRNTLKISDDYPAPSAFKPYVESPWKHWPTDPGAERPPQA